MNRIRIASFVLILIFSGMKITQSQTEKKLDGFVFQIQKRYRTLQTLSAKFTQTSVRHNIMGNIETFEQKGRLSLRKPGKIRWDYQKPQKNQYISNGKTLWLYKQEENQVIVSKWNENSLALRFLLGQGQLNKNFNIQYLSQEMAQKYKITQKKDVWLNCNPKKGNTVQVGAIDTLILRVDPKKHLIKEALVIDAIGSQTNWSFEKFQINKKIPNAFFEFKIPKGVQVIYQ